MGKSNDWCLYSDTRNVFYKETREGVVIHTQAADRAAWFGTKAEAYWAADKLPASTVKEEFVPAHCDSFVTAEDPD